MRLISHTRLLLSDQGRQLCHLLCRHRESSRMKKQRYLFQE